MFWCSRSFISKKQTKQIVPFRSELMAKRREGRIDSSMIGSLENCLQNLDRLLNKEPDGRPSLDVPVQPNFTAPPQIPPQVQLPIQPNFSAPPPKLMERRKEKSIADLEQDDALSVVSSTKSIQKTISDLLVTQTEVKNFIADTLALVLLQTGRKNYTNQGLFSMMLEFMKKLEVSETEGRLWEFAKKFNAANVGAENRKIEESHQQSHQGGPDMMKFTPEELVCLLKNFDTLTQEERKCFQYYMTNLKMKKGSLTKLETNILDLYSLKSKEGRRISK